MRRDKDHQTGFTLLEIIVALAITAVGIAAAAKYTASAATVAYETEQRMFAVWTAGNRLSELRIERAWPEPGSYDRQAVMGGRTWYLTETVAETDHVNIRRIDIQVYIDADHNEREFNLYGYLARYLPPEEPPEGGPGGSGPQGDQEGDEETESLSPGDEIPLPGDEEIALPGDEEIPLPGDEVFQDSEDPAQAPEVEPQGGAEGQPASGENQ